MTKISLITTFLLLSSFFLAGCLFQRDDQTSPSASAVTQPTPVVTPVRSASPLPSVSPTPDLSASEEDTGLPPVQGNEINEGEELVQ